MNIIIEFPRTVTADIRTLITWEHPVAVRDGYCASCRPNDKGEPQGQYSMAPVHIPGTSTYSENTNATGISNAEMQKIASLQLPHPNYTIDQMMNWAMDGGNDTWGQIIRATYKPSSEWRKATNIRMIAAVYAGQDVEVLEYKDILLTDLDGGRRLTPMARIRTFQPHEWGVDGSLQIVTSVTAENKHQLNKSLFRMPIYFGNREAYVFQRWLKPL